MRTTSALGLVTFGLVLFTQVGHADPHDRWEPVTPSAPWVTAAADEVQSYGGLHKPTALMIVRDGYMVASWGEISRKVNVRSVRKSLLGGLYGIAVAEGRIDLASTLEQLGIEDKLPSLTQAEKQATIRDLLMSRSGVYHPASYESAEMQEKRPARGSQQAGSSWSITIGISTHSVRFTARLPARIYSKVLLAVLHDRLAWKIFPSETVDMFFIPAPAIRHTHSV
jgi:CubicO group peptidase (beta-lactamase class C family)